MDSFADYGGFTAYLKIKWLIKQQKLETFSFPGGQFMGQPTCFTLQHSECASFASTK